jgi:hypothetical protein
MSSKRVIKQKGVALVVGLLLLLVSSFVAVAAFQSGMFQERMASNQHNKAVALMAAEQGGSAFFAALDGGLLDIAKWADSPFATWQTNTGGVSYYRVANVSSAGTDGKVWDAVIEGVSRRSANDPENLALSRLNLRIQGEPTGGGAAAAINLAGPLGTFEVPNSGSMDVIGAYNGKDANGDDRPECVADPDQCYGPAIAVQTSTPDPKTDAEKISDALEDAGRLHKYKGGIGERNFEESMFARTDEFVTEEFIQDGATYGDIGTNADLGFFLSAACHAAGNRCSSVVPDGTVTKGNPHDLRTPQLTVVTGNADIDFQGSEKGAGVLIVAGDLITKGTPSWDGVILVLGGSFNIVGGGTGGVSGTVYVLDVVGDNTNWDNANWTAPGSPSVSFLSTPPESSNKCEDDKKGGAKKKCEEDGATKGGGGGNATFIHNCAQVRSSLKMVTDRMDWLTLDKRNELLGIWVDEFGCGGPTGSGSGPVEYTLLRWVEILN